MASLQLDTELQYVKGVGPRRSALLKRRGIRRVEDILFHFPRRYEDRTRFAPLDSLRPGVAATILAKVYSVRWIRTRARGGLLDVVLTDGTSFIHAKWFNGGHLYKKNVFSAGTEVVATGKPESDRYDTGVVLFNPEFEVVPEGGPNTQSERGEYVPIYEELAGVTSRQVRAIVRAALEGLADQVHDPLPEELRRRLDLPEIGAAFRHLHQPRPGDDLDQFNQRRSSYHRRFIFEEFLLMELTLALRRHQLRATNGVRFETSDGIRERLKAILSFHPTSAQKRALGEIVEDLRASHPMSRLLQGDVGSGKTIVAFQTVVIAVENLYQAVIMAPTEILAEQHYINARSVFSPLGYNVVLVRKASARDDPKIGELVRSGEAQLVIGTHAVLEERAAFHRLGLVVIDEQHRFGVLQRLKLMEKGERPNTLVMTATPIPRTLAMTFYGDLDVSVIDEMPPGRTPIETQHVRERQRSRAEDTIRRELDSGRQCYVVYPLIEESEKLDLRSATKGYEQLVETFPEASIGLLHGRMKSDEKEGVMQAFNRGELGVLVSTTVVEVGVDVPNATVMVIEHAERFGIAQLHQLRGRVGRGMHASTCLLMTPDSIGDVALERVGAVAATTDGFRLAETDLRLRGPGELAGTRQSGMPEFRVADLVDDMDILVEARDEAERWVGDETKRNRLIEGLSRGQNMASLVSVG
jgi:ATP-dependent DNA helicase RecG